MSKPNQSPLDQAITETVRERAVKLEGALRNRLLQELTQLLPRFMAGKEDRVINRAILYWKSNTAVQACTDASFLKCTLQAAELGFCLDGRMCYAVPYDTKVKDAKGGDRWEKQAQMQVDYKGLIAVAKRGGLVQDVWSRLVMPTDEFSLVESDGKTIYRHVPDFSVSRDDFEASIGVFTVATHRDGWYRVDYMAKPDIERIRERSKAYQGAVKYNNNNSPWHTDAGEMAKKTCARRLLKTFTDDPDLLELFTIEDEVDRVVDRSLEAAGLSLPPIVRRAPVPAQVADDTESEPAGSGEQQTEAAAPDASAREVWKQAIDKAVKTVSKQHLASKLADIWDECQHPDNPISAEDKNWVASYLESKGLVFEKAGKELFEKGAPRA